MKFFTLHFSAFLIPVFALLNLSCKDSPDYDNSPKISDIKLEQVGTGFNRKFNLKFNYQDGNGDLGLSDSDIASAPYQRSTSEILAVVPCDTCSNAVFDTIYALNPNHYNLFIRIYNITLGDSLIWAGNLNPPIYSTPKGFTLVSTFPRLSDKDRDIDGTLSLELQFSSNPLAQKQDEVYLELYIQDRDFNKSNTLSTGPFSLN